ncbi:MAG: class I SAM-dependent methyltransferase, partial [Cytophagales bacterium]|nr:class I SAM-dependent methyltransferase [Cytophagales bacterium]
MHSYHGIDFSENILAYTRRQVAEKGLKNVRLSRLEAIEVDTLDETGFDVIVLNSVVQSFEGHNYFRAVLAKAIALLGETGVIVVGDVQDL